MINFVTIIGKVHHNEGEIIVRLEVNRIDSDLDANNLFIPCKYWTRDAANLLTSLADGTLIAVRGRIDYDNEIGFHIIVEHFTIIANNR